MKYFLAFIKTDIRPEGFYKLVRSGNKLQANSKVSKKYPDAWEVNVTEAIE